MKIRISGGFGVPEVWRFEGHHFSFWQLTCVQTAVSRAFPFLSPPQLGELVANCDTVGHLAARKMLRDWVRTARPR